MVPADALDGVNVDAVAPTISAKLAGVPAVSYTHLIRCVTYNTSAAIACSTDHYSVVSCSC